MHRTILGIEGTAWNLSAGVVTETDVLAEATATYRPKIGGIHPREAAQHHATHIASVIRKAIKLAGDVELDGIAFSQGPGMGPCLRTVATAARALALSLDVPLIGVNHCVAHLEIGRWQCGIDDPVMLYVSGLAYRGGRYRIFGETLDIGIGNALDKFARHAGFSHPGGPKIESEAGMDFSFSGLMTAAKEALKKHSLADVCFSLQETAFAMLVEVTERAVAHTEKNDVLLAGGVGANTRLREMLEIMCADRGAAFHVPEKRFMGDNGTMIAYTGLLMLASGESLPIEDSVVIPDFRPDQVDATWRSGV